MSRYPLLSLAALPLLSVLGCDAADSEGNPGDAAGAAGKADVIDKAELELVRLSNTTLCTGLGSPEGDDCGGFIEVHPDGTMIFDEFTSSAVHELQLTDAETAQLAEVMTNPELLEFLEEESGGIPALFTDHLTVVIDGVEFSADLPLISDDPAITEATSILRLLANKHVTAFEGLRVSRGGFCPPEIDCNGFLAVDADGVVTYDGMGDEPREARLSTADFQLVLANATRPKFLDLLGDPDTRDECIAPTDISESMQVWAHGETFQLFTLGCDHEPFESMRAIVDLIVGEYFTPEPPPPELPAVQMGDTNDPGDLYSVVSASIEDDVLTMVVTHSGGCAEHGYELNWNGALLKSLPPQATLQMHHDANGDDCEALLTETLRFDLTPLQAADPFGEIIINLDMGPTGLRYTY